MTSIFPFRWWLLVLAGSVTASGGAAFAWDTQVYGSHALAAVSETALVPESSGVVASRLTPDLYWTHNDSGHSATVYAFRLRDADVAAGVAPHRATVTLTGASSVDWEDIAAGPEPFIYVFDGGDNPPCGRTDKRIHRFAEPFVDPDAPAVTLSLAVTSIRFEYPDSSDPALPADTDGERYDAESLAVHPTTGDLYVMTKRTNSSVPASRVYKLAAGDIAWGSATVHVLEFVADVTASVPLYATAMDIDADGRRLLARNYSTAYEFTLPAGQAFDAIFATTPRSMGISGETQGEAIAYDFAGANIITTSETAGSGPFDIFRVPWLLANLRAEDVTNVSARIAWQTADALDARVDYGLTTAYGLVELDAGLMVDHSILLTGLQSDARYYYKATSGALAYPPSGDAASVFFDTLAFPPADTDQDGDVDLSDYGAFLSCYNGPGQPAAGGAECDGLDDDDDGDVDLADYGVFLDCYNGPNNPPACE
jgi:hypothetical protein